MRFSAAELACFHRTIAAEASRRKYRHLRDFVQAAWPIVEGSNVKFVSNWHIDLICEHLEAVFSREVNNLLMNVPPGSMKSIITSVCWPVWVWLRDPAARFLTASYGQDLATRDAVRSRALVESQWFKEIWGSKVELARNQNQKTKYETTAGGWRLATSVGGRGTGEHPSYKIIDDPHNVKQAESEAERQSALDWYDLTLTARGASRDAQTVVIMQRLHEKDLSGHIMAKEEFEDEWDHVCLPMRFEPGRYSSAVGADQREVSGESLLWPSLFSEEKVAKLERALGVYGTAGQLQQRPSPPGGGILKTKHFQLWPANKPLPVFEFILQSYDTAFKELHDPRKSGKSAPDFSACSVYGLFTVPGDSPQERRLAIMILDAWEERLSYPKLREIAIRDWQAFYGGDEKTGRKGRRADQVIIEDKASGQSLIQDMRLANIPVIPWNPGRADKVAKAHIAAPVLELDCFYVLESTQRPGHPVQWVKFMLDRVEKFPNDEFDDIVDTFTQAAIYFKDQRILDLDYVPPDEKEEEDYHAKRRVNPYSR